MIALVLASPLVLVPAQEPLDAASRLRTVGPPRSASVTTPSAPGSFLGGSDDCAMPHVDLGIGPVSDVPFVTGTTGTEGQNEPACLSPPGVELDVWFDWTADRDGRANWRTCGGTTRDTRLVVWPFTGSASCPAVGSSLACNDDVCFGPSSLNWDVTAGTTYTLQLGLQPGELPASGTFDIAIWDGPSCDRYDDGSTEFVFGHAGGEIGWLHMFECFEMVRSVQTAYGTPVFPGRVMNGAGSRVAIYEDLDDDGDARTGMQLLEVVQTTVVNGSTDILNEVVFPGGPHRVSGGMFVLATGDYSSGQGAAPMDLDTPTPHAWVVSSSLGPGTIDLDDLGANSTAVTSMTSIGYPTAWLLRATGDLAGPGVSFCAGDGTATPCPCGNTGGAGEGCANSTGAGALLDSTGSASVGADDLVFDAMQLPPFQPALLFAGDSQPGGGSGVPFGDGLRCAGGSVARLGVRTPDAGGAASWGPDLGATGGWAPGDMRSFQVWHRDPGGPCGSGFNLSNGIEVAFVP